MGSVAPGFNIRGAFWTQNKQFVGNGFRLRFTYVTYSPFTDEFSPEPADGIVFVIQNNSNDMIGERSSMGYNFPKSLALELDFFQNAPPFSSVNDPNGNHIGFHSSGSITNPNSVLESFLVGGYRNTTVLELCDDLIPIQVEVVFQANQSFEVKLNNVTSLSGSLNLASLAAIDASGMAWIGITGSSGSAYVGKDITEFLLYEFNVDPDQTIVHVPQFVAQDSSVTAFVQLVTLDGINVTVSGSLKNAPVTAPTTCSSSSVSVNDNQDGSYTLVFTATVLPCSLTILVGGVTVGTYTIGLPSVSNTPTLSTISTSTSTATSTPTPSTSSTSTSTSTFTTTSTPTITYSTVTSTPTPSTSTFTSTTTSTATATSTPTPSTSSTSTSTRSSTTIFAPSISSTSTFTFTLPGTSTPFPTAPTPTQTSTSISSTPSAIQQSSSSSSSTTSTPTTLLATPSSSFIDNILSPIAPVPSIDPVPSRMQSTPVPYFLPPEIGISGSSGETRASLPSGQTSTITYSTPSNQTALVIISPDAVLSGTTVSIKGISERPSSSLSDVIDITFSRNGEPVQPISSIEICFDIPEIQDSACLGYFNTRTRSWICQDRCLKRRGNSVCGETDHLTNFAILLSGIGEGGCDSAGDYIFSTAEQDAILIGSVVVSLWCCLLMVVLIALYTKAGSYSLYGPEGTRILTLRNTKHLS